MTSLINDLFESGKSIAAFQSNILETLHHLRHLQPQSTFIRQKCDHIRIRKQNAKNKKKDTMQSPKFDKRIENHVYKYDQRQFIHFPIVSRHLLTLNLTLQRPSITSKNSNNSKENVHKTYRKLQLNQNFYFSPENQQNSEKVHLLRQNLAQIRKTCPFKKDIYKNTSTEEQGRRVKESSVLFGLKEKNGKNYYIKAYKIIDLEVENWPINAQQKLSHQKTERQDKNCFQKQHLISFNQPLIKRARLYITSQYHPHQKTLKLRCYFLNEDNNIIRVTDNHKQKQIMLASFRPQKNSEQKYELLLPKLNPQTGQVYFEFMWFCSFGENANMQNGSFYELLKNYQNYLSKYRKSFVGFLNSLNSSTTEAPNYFSQNILDKRESLFNESTTLIKSNLHQTETWLNKKVTQHKQLQKKRQNQLLLNYTFPKKVSEYEIMEDPFLGYVEKMMAIKELRIKESEEEKLVQYKQKINECNFIEMYTSALEYQRDRNVGLKPEIVYSRVLLGIKKTLCEANMEIERSNKQTNGHNGKHNANKSFQSTDVRKRAHSLIMPLNTSNNQKGSTNRNYDQNNDKSLQKLNLIQSQNQRLISRQIEKMRAYCGENNLSPIGFQSKNLETIVKFKTGQTQRFYGISPIAIQHLQQKIQVQRIFSSYLSHQKGTSIQKPTNLGFYLFDYKNHQAYEKYLFYPSQKSCSSINNKSNTILECQLNGFPSFGRVYQENHNIQQNHHNSTSINQSEMKYGNSVISISIHQEPYKTNRNIRQQPNTKSMPNFWISQQSFVQKNDSKPHQVYNPRLSQNNQEEIKSSALSVQSNKNYLGINGHNYNNKNSMSSNSNNDAVKSWVANDHSFLSLEWSKDDSQDEQNEIRKRPKLKLSQMPQNLFIFQNHLLFSIRLASKVIPLPSYLQRNAQTLTFHKKLYIFKQIIEFYYILEYHSLEGEIWFQLEDIYVNRSLNIKVDCGLFDQKGGKTKKKPYFQKGLFDYFEKQQQENSGNKNIEKGKNIYFMLIQIFYVLIFGEDILMGRKSFFKKDSIQQSKVFLKEQHMEEQGLFGANTQQVLKGLDEDELSSNKHLFTCIEEPQQSLLNKRVFQRLSEFRFLANHGDTTSIKFIWTLLFRYYQAKQQQGENQLNSRSCSSIWLFALVQKLQQLVNSG